MTLGIGTPLRHARAQRVALRVQIAHTRLERRRALPQRLLGGRALRVDVAGVGVGVGATLQDECALLCQLGALSVELGAQVPRVCLRVREVGGVRGVLTRGGVDVEAETRNLEVCVGRRLSSSCQRKGKADRQTYRVEEENIKDEY